MTLRRMFSISFFFLFCFAGLWGFLSMSPEQRALYGVFARAHVGDHTAQRALGWKYYTGQQELPRDYTHAKYWYQRAANGDDPNANAMMGVIYRNGRSVEKDMPQALAYFERGAALQSPIALYNLGIYYLRQPDGSRAHHLKAANYLRRSLNAGDFFAKSFIRRQIALCHGLDMEDFKERLKACALATAGGDALAMYVVGLSYYDARHGFELDDKEAKLWLVKAQKNGSIPAQIILAEL